MKQDKSIPEVRYIPFAVPALISRYDDLTKKFYDYSTHLIRQASQRVIRMPPSDGATRYGYRTVSFTTFFNIKVKVKVQRYKTPDGHIHSDHLLTLPNGRYDINIVFFAVILYSDGLPAESVRAVLQAALGVTVSVQAILNWVRLVGTLGFAEHRKALKRISSDVIKQIAIDEIYFTLALREKALSVVLMVDTEHSLILDEYFFRGNNITILDVKTIKERNKDILDSVEIITTDGAKAYTYMIDDSQEGEEQKDDEQEKQKALHIICLQHTTRNKRKNEQIKELLESIVEKERQYLDTLFTAYKERQRQELISRLNYVLPPSGMRKSVVQVLRNSAHEALNASLKQLEKWYSEAVERHMGVYGAMVQTLFYVKQEAALIGWLRNYFSNVRKYENALMAANTVAITTAMVEGMNRPLRNRFTRALRYRDPEVLKGISKLYLLKHNTTYVPVGVGVTPYEAVGIDAESMFWNPYRLVRMRARVMQKVKQGGSDELSNEAGRYRVRSVVYRRYRSEKRALDQGVFDILRRDLVDSIIEMVLRVREKIIRVGK